MKVRCPRCAEKILADDKECSYCGFIINGPSEEDAEPAENNSRTKYRFKLSNNPGLKKLLIIAGILLALFYFGNIGSINCDAPVEYSIGTIDSRFDINSTEAENIAQIAGRAWNGALGEEKFIYNKNSELKINFIYDERQANLDTMKSKMASLDVTYDSLDELNNKIETLINTYDSDLSDYENDVDYWNSRGGAPHYTYNRLENERARLDEQYNYINNLLSTYNMQQSDYNFSVENFNASIDRQKNEIETEGEYDPTSNVINIYLFNDEDELRLLLIHELGHTKTLAHAENENSIMYWFDSDNQLTITQEDIEMIKSCKGY